MNRTEIMQELAGYVFGIDYRTPTRHKEVIEARQAAWYVLHKVAKCSKRKIALAEGYDPTTVVHGVKTAETVMLVDAEFRRKVGKLAKLYKKWVEE